MIRKPKIILLIGAGLVAAGIAGWVFRHDEGVKTTLTLYGNVDVREVNLGFLVSGRLQHLAVEEGERVKSGQKVASLQKDYFIDAVTVDQAEVSARKAVLEKMQAGNRKQEIAKARADVATVQATYSNAKREYTRQKSLASQDFASRQRLDQARAAMEEAAARLNAANAGLDLMKAGFRAEDIRQARAELEAARAKLAIDQRRLKDSDLYAPADGIIMTRVREPGSIIGVGQPVYHMALTTPVWVRAYVAETDLGRVVPGMAANITADSLPGKNYRGSVGYISPVAEFTPKSVETPELRTSLVYRLRIVVPHADENLRQGMPVTVTLLSGNGK